MTLSPDGHSRPPRWSPIGSFAGPRRLGGVNDYQLRIPPLPLTPHPLAGEGSQTYSSPLPLGEGLSGYKRPESVLVVIYTAADQVLALRRCQPPDFWQSVTGSLRWDETDPVDAARRELFEETGLGEELDIVDCGVVNRFPILPAWRHRYAPDALENVEHVFRVRLPERRLVALNPAEHSEYEWLPRTLAAARMTSWTNRNAILALPL